MKAIYKIWSVVMLSGIVLGCDDFLERSAQNLIIPQTVDHYTELLQGDAYFKDLYAKTRWIQFMTDDAEFQEGYSRYSDYAYLADNIEAYGDVYTWQSEIENEDFTDGAYLYLYKQVKVANICIDGALTAEGEDKDREILLGQAYFTRAMAYFYLANLYAQAYNEASPSDPCVPLVLEAEINEYSYDRATIEQVWGQITSDIQNALTNLKDKTIVEVYTISYDAVLALATRVYLFMEDWDNAIKYGEELLARKPDLLDISNETKAANSTYSDAAIPNFIRIDNPEIIWNFNTAPSSSGSGSTYYSLMYAYGTAYLGYWLGVSSQSVYAGQQTLIEMYDADETALTGDRRLLYWFILPSRKTSSSYVNNYNTYRSLKYDTYDKNVLMQCLRTGEIYVSLAEAYARRNEAGDDAKAVEYLNALRVKRINPYTNLALSDFATNEELVQFCWDERRRELCFEECHRWWDMRRQGQKKVVHRYNYGGTSGNSFVTFTLAEKDPAYILNFPLAERNQSPNLEPNSRPMRAED
ncbi:MAG: RagB/SusD family nutrient uptake outer membrane protein [Marinifilaceae bacterium]|nr:RagB/SusD family nutrient uptake outer membrane protein [Marinifilaceae bacterium]